MNYDPKSSDSMFGRILERLDTQDRDSAAYREDVKANLAYIRLAVDRTNGRVTELETARAVAMGQIALISFSVTGIVGVAGFIVSILLGFVHP